MKKSSRIVTHYLQPQANGWPRQIDVFEAPGGGLRFLAKTYQIFADGTLSWKALPTMVSQAEIDEAQRTVQLYVSQVLLQPPPPQIARSA
jgi:hypothetical protein